MKRQTLSLDIEALFPGSTIKIGNQAIIIRPLNITQIAEISKKLTGVGMILSNKDITWENFNLPKNLFSITTLILENVPEVLEEASNIALSDLQQLPLEMIVVIVNAVIEENLKSKEVLEKNFKSLTEKFLPEQPKKKKTKGKK